MRMQLLQGWIGLSIGVAISDWMIHGTLTGAAGKIFCMGLAFAWVAFTVKGLTPAHDER